MYVIWRQARVVGAFAAALSAAPLLQAAPPRAASPSAPYASLMSSGQSRPGQQRIYRGTYHRRGAAAPEVKGLFWYERWHEVAGSRLRSTHVHHRLDGRVVLRQSVLHSRSYELVQLESDHRQTGVRAEARVLGGGRVRLQRTTAGARGQAPTVETVELTHRHPLVVGPTLYGMILRHWSELAAGRRVTVDYLSIEQLDTFGFELQRVAGDATTVTFELVPSSFFLGLLVAPLRIVFASESRQVLRYEGPSPVLLEQGGELESFEARIEYSERAAPFR